MNKQKTFSFSLTLLLVFFLSPFLNAYGNDRYYDVSQFKMAVDIQENGDALVSEEITYDFSGNFNGILRDIDSNRTDGVENIEIFVWEGETYVPFSENYNGAAYTYELGNDGDLKTLKIYEQSSNEKKTFKINYTLVNVAEKYDDIGILNRKMIDSGWDVDISDVTITMTIPEGATKEELKVFAHGPLTGESIIEDGRTFTFKAPYLSGQFLETLVIFPPELIGNSTNIFNEVKLPEILENEGRLADEANAIREEAIKELEAQSRREAMERASRPFFLAGIAGAFVALISMFRKFTKEIQPTFTGEYYRELPEDYSPAVMTYLLTKGKSKDEDIMATILDLARKKVINLAPVTVERGKFFKKEEESFRITWRDKSKLGSLLPHEEFLATWFVDDLGGSDGLVLDELESIVKKQKNALAFQKDYQYFKAKVKDIGEDQKFFAPNNLSGAKVYVIIALVLIALGLVGMFFLGSFFGIIMAIFGGAILILLMVLNFVTKLSLRGAEHTAMWNAFRKFLKDFSNMKEAEIPSLVIWEHYLVYATSLGVAEDVIDQLPKVFTEVELNNPNLTYMGGYRSFNSMAYMNRSFSNTMTKVSSAVSSAQIASSKSSSGGGFGGGFSGGSSGGGGGGGGGGAF